MVIELLKYFRDKRKSILSEVETQFNDLRDMNLLEDMYTREELEIAIDGLRDVLRINSTQQLEKFRNQVLEVVKDAFLQAEGFRLTLTNDIHTVEDGDLLDGIAKLNLDPLPGALFKAPSIASVAGGEAGVQMKINDANETIQRLGKREGALKKQLANTQRESEALKKELDALKIQLSGLDGSNSVRTAYEVDKEKLARDITQATADLSKTKEALSHKVSDSKQFIQFKGMINKKNNTLREVREQIAELEK